MQIDPQEWPALSGLLDRLLDLPTQERLPWVQALTGADAAYAPRLLELLKSATDSDATGLFATLPKLDELATTVMSTVMRSGVVLEEPGNVIGPYRLVRQLGRGGMGSVWYAERSDALVRRGVALKLPLSWEGGAQLAARFAREREIVARLTHPYIARLYDAGVTESGQAYLALEYVEGIPLDQYCNQHRLDVPARLRLFTQVLEAVQYAHSQLVIHRDIKPANILVTREAQVRLLDFGVAKMFDPEETESSELTRLGAPGMTLAYAAPEQVAGETVSTAADIYSLGVVLYQLLVGERPYRVKRDSRAALEEAVLTGDIPLASAANYSDAALRARATTAKRLRRALRGDLDAVLLRALKRQSPERYATAAAFAEDLDRVLNGRPARAHRATRGYMLRKFVARNRLAVAAAGASSLALLAVAAVALWQGRVAAEERDRAVAAAEHREAVDEFMSDLLLEAGLSGQPVSVSQLIERAEGLSAREFSANPEARAAVLRTVGLFAQDFDRPEKALASFQLAGTLLANSRDTALRVSLACEEAKVWGTLGHGQEAQQRLQTLIDDSKTPPSVRSECLGNMADLALFRSDGPAAEVAAKVALTQWEALPQGSPIKRLELQTYEAMAQAMSGQPAKAESTYVKVMEQLRQVGRERGRLAGIIRESRIETARSSGAPLLALAQIDEALAIQALDIPDKPPQDNLLLERAYVLSDIGRFREALAAFDRAANVAATQDKVIEQQALYGAAGVLSTIGLGGAAENKFQFAAGMADPELAGQGAYSQISRHEARALLDLNQGRAHTAREELTAALRAGSTARPTLPTILRLRAQAELAEHDLAAAMEDARRSLTESEQMRGDRAYSNRVGEAQLVLGLVMQARGDLRGAREAYSSAVEQLTHTVDGEHPDLRRASRLLRQPGDRVK